MTRSSTLFGYYKIEDSFDIKIIQLSSCKRCTQPSVDNKILVKMKFLIVFFAIIMAALAAPQFGGKFNYKVQKSFKVEFC